MKFEDIKQVIKTSEFKFGKKFANQLIEYVENAESEMETKLIESIIKSKLEDETQQFFFKLIKKLISLMTS